MQRDMTAYYTWFGENDTTIIHICFTSFDHSHQFWIPSRTSNAEDGHDDGHGNFKKRTGTLLLDHMQHHHHHVPCPLSCFGCKLYSRFNCFESAVNNSHKNTSKYGHPWTDTVISVGNVKSSFQNVSGSGGGVSSFLRLQ